MDGFTVGVLFGVDSIPYVSHLSHLGKIHVIDLIAQNGNHDVIVQTRLGTCMAGPCPCRPTRGAFLRVIILIRDCSSNSFEAPESMSLLGKQVIIWLEENTLIML